MPGPSVTGFQAKVGNHDGMPDARQAAAKPLGFGPAVEDLAVEPVSMRRRSNPTGSS